MQSRNRYLEAFKESYNVIGLTTAVAASLALMATPFMPIPILVGLVAEAAYILFVSDSRWYQMRLAKRFDGEIEKRRAELKMRVMPQLRPQMQARFTRLEEVRRSIAEQAQSNGKEQPEWFREVLRKLDFLLEKFLHFASKDAQFRGYLESVLVQECGDANVQSGAQSGAQSNSHKVTSTQLGAAAQLQSNRGLGGSLAPSGQTAKSARLHGNVPAPPAPIATNTANGNSPSAPASASFVGGTDAWTQAAIVRIQQQYDHELTHLRRTAETNRRQHARRARQTCRCVATSSRIYRQDWAHSSQSQSPTRSGGRHLRPDFRRDSRAAARTSAGRYQRCRVANQHHDATAGRVRTL
jgi:hypothetical protein